MKKNQKEKDTKKAVAICGLSGLCIASLTAAFILMREPETEFVPMQTQTGSVTDTWEEHSNADTTSSTASSSESSQKKGDVSDQTQTVISEDSSGSTSSLSDSSTRLEAALEKPTEKPTTSDDVTNPNKKPSYGETVTQQSESPIANSVYEESSTQSTTVSSDVSTSGNVYDPVFGWINTGETRQDSVDSSGDINTQIGTMGGN